VRPLGTRSDERGLECELERAHQPAAPVRPLAERPQRLLLPAVERGYYDVPRQSPLTEVADRVGIAKSTWSATSVSVDCRGTS